jgi:hypothetical protein
MTETPQEAFDAARRCAEAYNFQLAVHGMDACGRWIAVRLSDGGSDAQLYDTKDDAIRHQLHENLCAYICIVPGRMSEEDAASILRVHRVLYDNGARLSDPDKHVQMPARREFLQ